MKAIQRDVGITFVFVTHDQGEALSMSSRVAVFNHGRIEQVGTPREIYAHPTTMFVAGFVGTSNVLDAQRSFDLLGVRQTHSVRPERIRLVVGDDLRADEVAVDGTVTDVQYLGAESRVRVDLADGAHLLANVPSDGLDGVAVGSDARMAWPRTAAFAVAETNSEGEEQL